MTRGRSREQETEDVVPRRLKRGAIERVHVAPWAIGKQEIAPGVVDGVHLGPRIINETHIHPSTVSALSGVGQMLVLSTSADSIASGGDYVTFDTIIEQVGFADVAAASDSWLMPITAVGVIEVELSWDTYEGGGRVELEVDGYVADSGIIGDGSEGAVGRGSAPFLALAGGVCKLKVTQASGSAQTADITVRVAIPDPTPPPEICLQLVFADDFNSGVRDGWTTIQGALADGVGPDGSDAWEVTNGAGGTPTPRIDWTATAQHQRQRWVLRFDHYQAGYPSATADQAMMGIAGIENHVKIDITTAGAAQFYANGLRYTSPAGTVLEAQWQSWEFDVTLDPVDGAAKLTVDGTVLYNATGLNTASGPFTEFVLSVAGVGNDYYDNVELWVDTCAG